MKDEKSLNLELADFSNLKDAFEMAIIRNNVHFFMIEKNGGEEKGEKRKQIADQFQFRNLRLGPRTESSCKEL
jgi:hypothetical protein